MNNFLQHNRKYYFQGSYDDLRKAITDINKEKWNFLSGGRTKTTQYEMISSFSGGLILFRSIYVKMNIEYVDQKPLNISFSSPFRLDYIFTLLIGLFPLIFHLVEKIELTPEVFYFLILSLPFTLLYKLIILWFESMLIDKVVAELELKKK